MENKGYNCGDTEYNNESKQENDNCGCGCEETEVNEDLAEENSGCGCEEYPDTSLVDNPDKPEFMASNDFIEEFENFAQSEGVKSIGYTQLTPELLIKDKFIQYTHAIVLTMELNKTITETEPGEEAYRLNNSFYKEFGEITYKISGYLRENGFATEVAHPFEGIVNYSLLAQYAGLGYIGKSGLLITPELGPRQKISAIFVSIINLPVKEENEHSWIPDYCDKCSKCVKSCPKNAFIERKTCFGGKETEFVQRLCIGCVKGCAYCIRKCPFDDKGYDHIKNRFDKMTDKLMEKKQK